MNLKISNTIKGMFLFLACLATVGCGKEDVPAPGNNGELQVVLSFSASSGLTARTQLPGPDFLQHVQTMRLYIFDGKKENSVCVASEDVDWKDVAAPEGKPTVTKNHKVQYKGFVVGQTYTFLAVGMDDCSGATFGLPASVKVNQTTLAEAKAVLDMVNGRTRNDIAQSELFGGSLELTPIAAGMIMGTVELKRRVAGVFGYFKNIPVQVGTTPVKSLRIELYKAQNKSIWLTAKPKLEDDVIMDPIIENEDNKILVELPLTPENTIKDKVISKGAYVLPMIAPFATIEDMQAAGYNNADIHVKDYTLMVTLVAEDGRILQRRKVKYTPESIDSGTDGGTGIITVSKDPYRFAINANWFYRIGRLDKPVDWKDFDSNIVITVNPDWDWIGDLEWAN